MFSGASRGDFFLITGDNGSGKSALINTAMKHFSEIGEPYYFWSGENMPTKSMARLISALTLIPTRKIESGAFISSTSDKALVDAAIAKADKGYLDGGAMSISKLRRVIPVMKRKGIEIIFLDRLELFDEVQNAKSSEQIAARGKVCTQLRSLCNVYGITICCVAQFKNPESGRAHTGYPYKYNIYGGSQITSAATCIIGVHRPENAGQKQFGSDCGVHEGTSCEGKALLVIMKNNNDTMGDVMVEFVGACQFFRNDGDSMPFTPQDLQTNTQDYAVSRVYTSDEEEEVPF